jgi:precorrin-6A/cobalt-precorrin-6A reductase
MPRHLLILGGTAEARSLAHALATNSDWSVTTALAGRTLTPVHPPGVVRIGGFGGAEGLARFLREQEVSALVDATHPFARQISANAVEAARETGVQLLRLERPAWEPLPGDRWSMVDDWAAAQPLLPGGARVFLGIGLGEAAAFAGRGDLWFLLRAVDPPASPVALSQFQLVLGRGPFEVEAEIELLSDFGISHVATKNSGGSGAYAKLEAARRLHLPVIMKHRPVLPPARTASDAVQVLQWIEGIS